MIEEQRKEYEEYVLEHSEAPPPPPRPRDEIREQLNIPEEKRVVLGVALGYADESSPLARFVAPREPLDGYVRWFA